MKAITKLKRWVEKRKIEGYINTGARLAEEISLYLPDAENKYNEALESSRGKFPNLYVSALKGLIQVYNSYVEELTKHLDGGNPYFIEYYAKAHGTPKLKNLVNTIEKMKIKRSSEFADAWADLFSKFESRGDAYGRALPYSAGNTYERAYDEFDRKSREFAKEEIDRCKKKLDELVGLEKQLNKI